MLRSWAIFSAVTNGGDTVTKAPKLRSHGDKKMARCAVIVRIPYGDAVRRYYFCIV